MRITIVTLLLSLFTLMPSEVFAAGPRAWIGAHLGLSTYSMSDVNDDIGAINSALAGTGLSMDEINGGLIAGGVFGIEFPNGFTLGAGIDRLNASSEVGDASGGIEYDLPANAFRVLGQFAFKGRGRSGAHVGASLGKVSSSGSVSITETGVGSVSADLEGSGPLFEGYFGGDWWASPQFAITGSAGFRYAKIGDLEVDGETVYTADGDKYTIDYTGVFARAGIKFAFSK